MQTFYADIAIKAEKITDKESCCNNFKKAVSRRSRLRTK